MNESVSRRNFFSRIGSAAFRGLESSEPEKSLSVRENPFPGQLYWDVRTQNWNPAYGVNPEGQRLQTYDHPDSILTVLEAPPQISSLWNFRLGRWVLPLGGRDVLSRTVMGSELIRELYSIRSQTREAQSLWQLAQDKWPQVRLENAALVGKSKKTDGHAEEILSLVFKEPLKEDPVLLDQFDVRDFIQKFRPDAYSLKISLSSDERFLRFYFDDSQGVKAPEIPLPAHFRGANKALNILPGGKISSRQVYNLYASNEDMKDYCDSLGLLYPENIFEMKRTVQIFGVTYDSESLKVLGARRYYKWWLP